MKKVLLITYDRCDDSEVLYPQLRCIEEGWELVVASMEKRMIEAKYHYKIEAVKLLCEVDPNEYDGLILPGGTAPEKIRLNEDAKKICRHFMEHSKPVCAICHGVQLLISARVLNGINCTCYPGICDDVINAGGIYSDSPVVVDKNLVTSRRPEDLPYFMREFVKLMNK